MASPLIFDTALLRRRRRRAVALGAETFLIDRVARDLAERLSVVRRRFELTEDLGTPTDAVRRALNDKIGTLIAVDAVVEHLRQAGSAIAADAEALPFRDDSVDLIVSG